MKKYFFYALILTLAACHFSKTETIEKKDENGKLSERFERRTSDFAKEGKFQAFFPSGKLRQESYYRNDSIDGVQKFFYENGQVEIIEHLKNGSFEGKYQHFYPDGTLDNEGIYQNNEMTGAWVFHYKNGMIKEVVNFKKNEENGQFKEYYNNGILKTEGAYLNGDNENGPLRMYDSLGMLVKTMDCDSGICRTSWVRK
jgi:antitoxin component YwqK of YwqJK toxin-antitoxin module